MNIKPVLTDIKNHHKFDTLLVAWCLAWGTYDIAIGSYWLALFQFAVMVFILLMARWGHRIHRRAEARASRWAEWELDFEERRKAHAERMEAMQKEHEARMERIRAGDYR